MPNRLTPHSKFLVLGRAGMDLYADPPGTQVEHATGFYATIGGSSGNIAAGLARHGLSASLLTCVSNDAVGRFVVRELKNFGVDTRHIVTLDGEMRTSLAVTETRIADTQNTLYRNNAADLMLSEEHVSAVAFDKFEVLIVTGTALAVPPSRMATLRAMQSAGATGALVVLDLDYRPYSWQSAAEAAEVYGTAAGLSDLVVGNDDEFAVMANGDHALGRDLAARLGKQGKTVIYKMGEKGSVAFTRDEEFSTGIFQVNALKPMGAGDAFIASLMASLTTGARLKEAVRNGSAAAAMVVSRIGCAPAMPTTTELNEFIEHQSAMPA